MARHQDLICWQLGCELRTRVLALTQRPGVRRDLRFCDQLRAACRSVTSNIAEGFGRRSRREFARHLDIALASVREVEDLIGEAHDASLIEPQEREDLQRLLRRITTSTARLANAIRRFPDL